MQGSSDCLDGLLIWVPCGILVVDPSQTPLSSRLTHISWLVLDRRPRSSMSSLLGRDWWEDDRLREAL